MQRRDSGFTLFELLLASSLSLLLIVALFLSIRTARLDFAVDRDTADARAQTALQVAFLPHFLRSVGMYAAWPVPPARVWASGEALFTFGSANESCLAVPTEAQLPTIRRLYNNGDMFVCQSTDTIDETSFAPVAVVDHTTHTHAQWAIAGTASRLLLRSDDGTITAVSPYAVALDAASAASVVGVHLALQRDGTRQDVFAFFRQHAP